MDDVRLFNPFLKKPKFKSYPSLSDTAKRIYRDKIKKGFDPNTFLPSNINYNKKTKKFSRIKINKDRNNVRNLTYQQVKSATTFGKSPISVCYDVFKNYAGQTIRIAKQYTQGGVVFDDSQLEDIPPLKNGFGKWWEGFSWFLYIDSEYIIFDELMNEGLDPKFQAQLLFLTYDKVAKSNYQQYFKDGVSNCLLTPIREWAEEKQGEAQSKTALYRYSTILRGLTGYEEQYTDSGIPEDVIIEICNRFKITIQIDLPSSINSKVRFIRHEPQISGRKTKALKVFKFINTRINHIELNEVNSLNNYECIPKKQLKELFARCVDEGGYFMWKDSRSGGITQINTLDKIYRAEPDKYLIALEKFEEQNRLQNFRLDYHNNSILNKFIIDSNHYNGSIQFMYEEDYDDLIVEHIDMIKSYTRGSECDFYEGYLAKITDFRNTDKIMGVGIYQIRNIDFGGNTRIEKLKVLHNNNSYPSPELKFYQSLGITFDIIGGCWGATTNIEFTGDREKETGMYEKMDGLSHYCKWFGCLQMIQEFNRYNFTCEDIQFAGLNSFNSDCNVKFNNTKGQGIIEYKKEKVYHQHHIASFINSYARINLMKQLLLIKGDIIAVQVDGIYYSGETELTPLFKDEKKFTLNYVMPDTSYTEDSGGVYEFGDRRDFNFVEIHTGPGGCGKTHNNLVDKGLYNKLYVAPSWKLVRNKQEEYGCDVCVLAWLVHSDPEKWAPIFRNYSTIIIDEASMISNEEKDLIIERFEYHRLIFCGDLGFQLPCIGGTEFKVEDYPVIPHNTNRRCKCPKLQRRLDALRKGIELNKTLPILNKDFLGIDIIDKDDIDYDAKDLIISSIHRRKDYFTCKYASKEQLLEIIKKSNKRLETAKDISEIGQLENRIKLCNKFMDIEDRKVLEKYIVLDNTINYSNGQIVYEKVYDGTPLRQVKSELRHAYTIHSIQGETAQKKLFLDVAFLKGLRMVYTAFSRAQYLDQIVLIK